MRRTSFLALVTLVLSLFGVNACQQPAVPTNRPNQNSGGETVDRASIEVELLRIENDWPRVIKEKDVAAIERVEAEDVILIYPDGSTAGKAKDKQDLADGNFTADSIEMADLKVNVLDADSAVVNGRSIFKGAKIKLPDGKSMDISGQYRFVDTFHRRAGEWKLVAGASVKIQEPAAAASPAASASPAAAASPATKASPVRSPSPAARVSPSTTP